MEGSKKEYTIHYAIQGGYGIPTGFLGANAEFGLKYVIAYLGTGYTAFIKGTSGTLGYNVGLKGYLSEPDSKFRFGVNAGYGINNVFMEEGREFVVTGANVGAGFNHQFMRNSNAFYSLGISVPLLFTNNHKPKNEELINDFFPYFGFGYRW